MFIAGVPDITVEQTDTDTQHEGEQGMMVRTLLAAQKGEPTLRLVAQSLWF